MTQHTRALLFILLATAIWGVTFALIRDAVATLPVMDFVFWRFLIAALFILVVFYRHIRIRPALLFQGIILGVCFGSGVITQTMALTTTPASTVSFITSFEVLFVPLLLALIYQRWPRLNIIMAILLTLTGIALITLSHGQLYFSRGDQWALLCAFFFAVYTLAAGRFSHSNQPMTLTFVQAATLSVIAALSDALMHRTPTLPVTTNIWGAILFCALFASVISFYLQIRYQRFVGSTKTAIIFASEPIFATFTAALYLGERLTFFFLIGAALIISGILLAELKPRALKADASVAAESD